MARKLEYDKINKRTFMKENALKRGYCMNCKIMGKQLYRYWYENNIGGDDAAPRHTLTFCSIGCYRAYYPEKQNAD